MQGCIVKQKLDGNHPHFISPYSNWQDSQSTKQEDNVSIKENCILNSIVVLTEAHCQMDTVSTAL